DRSTIQRRVAKARAAKKKGGGAAARRGAPRGAQRPQAQAAGRQSPTQAKDKSNFEKSRRPAVSTAAYYGSGLPIDEVDKARAEMKDPETGRVSDEVDKAGAEMKDPETGRVSDEVDKARAEMKDPETGRVSDEVVGSFVWCQLLNYQPVEAFALLSGGAKAKYAHKEGPTEAKSAAESEAKSEAVQLDID
ncbi:unnamed protein product, partial [Effrenium voratum]